jgi:GTP-binding protein Era
MSESVPAPTPSGFRTGLAALVGRTNAGKSTLLNQLVGHKVSIVTPKPQTTRDALHGVVHRPGGQIVFVDTPGFFQTHASALVDELHSRAREAVEDLDVLIHLVDPTREPGPEDAMVQELVAHSNVPKLLCLGKSDVEPRPHVEHWRRQATGYVDILEVSGKTGAGVPELIESILQRLPVGEALYPEGEFTNSNRTFQITELIREQVYLQMQDEVPYRTLISVDRTDELPPKAPGEPVGLAVFATIFAPTDRLQRMLIGVGAKRIQQIRQFAKRELRRRLGCPIELEIDVLVDRGLKQKAD